MMLVQRNSLLTLFIFCQVFLFQTIRTEECSQLDLKQDYSNHDEYFSIETKIISSSDLIEVSLKQAKKFDQTFWFLLGAKSIKKLTGFWQPFSLNDGQVLVCSSSSVEQDPEHLVSNKICNQTTYRFYWSSPPGFNGTITFVARLFFDDAATGFSSSRHIQSSSVLVETVDDHIRYRDVNRS